MIVKIHKSCRIAVAICDKELIGKIFEEGNKQINLTTTFFKGEEKSEKEVIEIIEDMSMEDATFNIVGKKSCRIAKNLGLIDDSCILYIQDIPIGLVLI
jgi:hypothetical protein